MSKWWLFLSLGLHLLIVLTFILRYDKVKVDQKDIISIELKEIYGTSKSNHTYQNNLKQRNSRLPAPIQRLGSRERNEAYKSLGDRAAEENYIERLRQRIEPNWIRILEREIRSRRNARPCLVVLDINGDANGQILKIQIVQSCGWKIAEDAAVEAIRVAGLLPPPKEFLMNGILYLQWTFNLRR